MMEALIVLGFAVTLVLGLGIFATAKSAIHEIEACICLLMATVFFSGLGIINSIERYHRTLKEHNTNLAEAVRRLPLHILPH